MDGSSLMFEADELKAELDQILYYLSNAINGMANVEQELDKITSTLLLTAIGGSVANTPLTSAVNIAELAKIDKEHLFNRLFEIKQIVNLYKGFL